MPSMSFFMLGRNWATVFQFRRLLAILTRLLLFSSFSSRRCGLATGIHSNTISKGGRSSMIALSAGRGFQRAYRGRRPIPPRNVVGEPAIAAYLLRMPTSPGMHNCTSQKRNKKMPKYYSPKHEVFIHKPHKHTRD